MDFNDTPEEAGFRREVRAWLEKNAPASARSSRGAKDAKYPEVEGLAEAREWQSKKAAAGYAAITWPKEFGGRGGKPIDAVIYSQEESKYEVPSGYFEIGLGMCIPMVMSFGKEHHKKRYVRPALHGEEVWSQLFSEPAAGSDVAGIRMRAVRDGDDWVLNGQKIWTSGAHYSDFGMVITRTDPSVPKHEGLTMFFVDMKSPGVEVRPLRQATGGAEFNEVFFTDVRIPDDNRLGEVGQGWKVAIATLMHERNAISSGSGFLSPAGLLELARDVKLGGRPASEDPAVRERIADWYVEAQGLTFTNYRALTALSQGSVPGPEQSIHKIVRSSQAQQIAYFAMDLFGEAGLLAHDALGDRWKRVEYAWMWGAGMRIAGGTDEILRNIIAERVLGLPGEIRLDKKVPFKELAEVKADR